MPKTSISVYETRTQGIWRERRPKTTLTSRRRRRKHPSRRVPLSHRMFSWLTPSKPTARSRRR